MPEKDLFPTRDWYEGKTVRDFCRLSLDNFSDIKLDFDYAWFVEDRNVLPYGDNRGHTYGEVFSFFMDYSLAIPEDWDGLPYSIAIETVKEFFYM